MPQGPDVFVSYSHKDQAWLERFLTMFDPYAQNNAITIWSDQKVVPGNRWRPAIDAALKSAGAALLLVSPDFLASDFIKNHELPVLLDAEREGRIRLQWIAVRPSGYRETPIGELQALNDPAMPLSTLEASAVETELLKTCAHLKKVLLELENGTVRPPPPPQDIPSILRGVTDARQSRDEALKGNDQETKALINSTLDITIVLTLVMAKLTQRLEVHLKYDIELLTAIEEIRAAGSDPTEYGLPSQEEALRAFSRRGDQYDQRLKAMAGLFDGLESKIKSFDLKEALAGAAKGGSGTRKTKATP